MDGNVSSLLFIRSRRMQNSGHGPSESATATVEAKDPQNVFFVIFTNMFLFRFLDHQKAKENCVGVNQGEMWTKDSFLCTRQKADFSFSNLALLPNDNCQLREKHLSVLGPMDCSY